MKELSQVELCIYYIISRGHVERTQLFLFVFVFLEMRKNTLNLLKVR